MLVNVFIIESANTEEREQIFENREVVGLTEANYIENLNLDNLDFMVDELTTLFGAEVYVSFVDQQYQCKYYYSEEGINELDRLNRIKDRDYDEDLGPQFGFYNCNWYELPEDIKTINSEDNYIFVTSKKFKNCYDFANFLQVPLKPNCYFIWGVSDLEEVIGAKSYYNIFSNVKRINQIDTMGDKQVEDPEAIKWIVEYGVRQVQALIKGGVLELEPFIQASIPEWTLNPYSYFSNGIIIEFDLKPKPVPGEENSKFLSAKTILEQFNEDAQYRQTILKYMMTALCKYGLEFGKILTINNNINTVNYEALL